MYWSATVYSNSCLGQRPSHGLPDLDQQFEPVQYPKSQPAPVSEPDPVFDVHREGAFIKQEDETIGMYDDGYEGDEEGSV